LSDPSFSTDALGGISFRGSQNFKVLIDGRPSLLNGSEALQNIPVSSIARVEVVTNPSAKYQADSEVGIINVILKKQYSAGLSGQVGLRYDYRDKGNTILETNANFQAKWNKIRLYFQASASRDMIQLKGPTTVDIENPSTDYSFHRDRIMNQLLLAKNLNIQSGIDIETSKKNTLGFWAKIYNGNSDYNSISNDIDMQNDTPIILGRLDYKNQRKVNATQFTLENKYEINDKNELHILSDFSVTANKRNNFRDYFTANQNNPNNETQLEQAVFYQDEDRNRWHTELNYSNSINDSTKLEMGLLHEFYKRTNTFKEFNFNALVHDNNAGFEFNIYNAYINYSSIWKGIHISLGFRFEYSTRKLEGIENNSLTDIFPSITLGKNLEKNYMLTFNYTKRIRRPSARDLSPILLYSDNQVTWRGNPQLTDAKVHNVSFGIQKKFEKTTFNAELFYRLVDGGWFRVLESVGNNRFENYPITINKEENFGLEFSSTWRVSQKLRASLSGSFFKQQIDNKKPREDLDTNSSRFVFTTNYNPLDNLKLQFDVNYNGPTLYANSEIAETHFLNLSIQKKFQKIGLTLTLFANDFTGGNIYKQIYLNNGLNSNESTRLEESYPSSTKYFGFHLKFDFRNYKKKNVNPNIQFND
jgi:outer membrane receptor protein involved in Fe transport